MYLRKKTYFYEDYKFKRINNYYIIEGSGKLIYKERIFNLEDVFKDYCRLGKDLFLCIENIDFFSRIFLKSPKNYNIVLLPYSFETGGSKNSFLTSPLQTLNFGDSPNPNNNGIIEVRNYDDLINNSKVISLLLNFCRKYGIPYYENLEESMILEGITSSIPLTINIKDFLLTAITIYLLNEVKNMIDSRSRKNSIKNLIKLMTLPSNSTEEDVISRFNSYLNSFKELYAQELSSYKSYTTPIYTSNKGKSTIRTINLVQALSYYYLNTIELRGKFDICSKCGIPTDDLKQHLCPKCYDEDFDYYANTKKAELNSIHRDLKNKLLELNDIFINEELKKDPYNIHNPKYEDLEFLIKLNQNNPNNR